MNWLQAPRADPHENLVAHPAGAFFTKCMNGNPPGANIRLRRIVAGVGHGPEVILVTPASEPGSSFGGGQPSGDVFAGMLNGQPKG